MPKEIVINARPYETRIALMENGKAAELFFEKPNRNIVGNVYLGKVVKVLPGMQSAFVDIGLGKDAFLYVEEVIASLEKMLELWSDDDEGKAKSKGKTGRGRGRKRTAIRELLKKGEYLMVQVSKDRIGGKGARVTSHVSLPGRYFVLMPTVNRIGISRKIVSTGERSRLRDALLKLRDPKLGYIIRTAAERCPYKELERDVEYLHDLWEAITDAAEGNKQVGLLHRELNLMQRVLRDLFSKKFARVLIDDEDAYKAAVDFVQRTQKELASRVKLYTGKAPIFEEFGIEETIEHSRHRKVTMRRSGHIVIHQTEALVAIDVNTGRFVGSKNLEDTTLKTNLEAAKEIARQLRLRDLGGIIVIDFIDMEKRANRKALYERIVKELQKDNAESTVLDVNEFGMVILTRKRVRQSLEKMMSIPCPYCEGRAVVQSPATVAGDVIRELEKIAAEGVKGSLRVVVPPQVSESIEAELAEYLDHLRKERKLKISLVTDDSFHHEQFDIIEE